MAGALYIFGANKLDRQRLLDGPPAAVPIYDEFLLWSSMHPKRLEEGWRKIGSFGASRPLSIEARSNGSVRLTAEHLLQKRWNSLNEFFTDVFNKVDPLITSAKPGLVPFEVVDGAIADLARD